uniref:Uncharacterized protein n=1 Tax=Chromera velia CCMP2878 TaxID=1169474 RepID=A0A0G4HVT9_9ALVE|eukprot:Cvel_8925.t1-p1 / transcript=Cvel_8925.t1 / gene=Cvel_8925 / organism=Chromera_velia_CCMP2878 / gene_product=hypothetical protein / transcript_product=hypothetical protein / location=Cvel_scaffold502:43463-46618(-) / protein_length=593 / sequence_SO=supercontig / SO=protein_coding / is_pseudo=false
MKRLERLRDISKKLQPREPAPSPSDAGSSLLEDLARAQGQGSASGPAAKPRPLYSEKKIQYNPLPPPRESSPLPARQQMKTLLHLQTASHAFAVTNPPLARILTRKFCNFAADRDIALDSFTKSKFCPSCGAVRVVPFTGTQLARPTDKQRRRKLLKRAERGSGVSGVRGAASSSSSHLPEFLKKLSGQHNANVGAAFQGGGGQQSDSRPGAKGTKTVKSEAVYFCKACGNTSSAPAVFTEKIAVRPKKRLRSSGPVSNRQHKSKSGEEKEKAIAAAAALKEEFAGLDRQRRMKTQEEEEERRRGSQNKSGPSPAGGSGSLNFLCEGPSAASAADVGSGKSSLNIYAHSGDLGSSLLDMDEGGAIVPPDFILDTRGESVSPPPVPVSPASPPRLSQTTGRGRGRGGAVSAFRSADAAAVGGKVKETGGGAESATHPRGFRTLASVPSSKAEAKKKKESTERGGTEAQTEMRGTKRAGDLEAGGRGRGQGRGLDGLRGGPVGGSAEGSGKKKKKTKGTGGIMDSALFQMDSGGGQEGFGGLDTGLFSLTFGGLGGDTNTVSASSVSRGSASASRAPPPSGSRGGHRGGRGRGKG